MERPLKEQVYLDLTDTPYNIRREAGRGNSDFNAFSKQDTGQMVGLREETLVFGGHGHSFCSELQFSTWTEALEASTESATYLDAEGR